MPPQRSALGCRPPVRRTRLLAWAAIEPAVTHDCWVYWPCADPTDSWAFWHPDDPGSVVLAVWLVAYIPLVWLGSRVRGRPPGWHAHPTPCQLVAHPSHPLLPDIVLRTTQIYDASRRWMAAYEERRRVAAEYEAAHSRQGTGVRATLRALRHRFTGTVVTIATLGRERLDSAAGAAGDGVATSAAGPAAGASGGAVVHAAAHESALGVAGLWTPSAEEARWLREWQRGRREFMGLLSLAQCTNAKARVRCLRCRAKPPPVAATSFCRV